MKKLAIISTHPIQYYIPLYQQLAKNCDLKVFYTWGEKGAEAKYDPDFKQHIEWDIPLLVGYNYEFLNNTAKDPGSHHFNGIINPALISSIKNFDPAAILIYGWAYQSHLSALRYFKGKIPIWFRGDSTLIDEQKGLKQLLRSLFLKWVYRHVDKAFYVGTANKAYFEKSGLKPQQLIFAPHAIDNDRFAADRRIESNTLREQLNIKTDDVLILFAGKLESKKNPELLLAAFRKLNLENVHLLFVGNGKLEDALKSKVKKDASTKLSMTHVHFMDFQNQSLMPAVYQACDLFCLPSKGPGETWGLAVNEAMACGKAVLVSNKVGCAPDLVKAGVNGEVFVANNFSDLKSKLQNLLKDKARLTTMGIESKKMIQHWSFEIQVKQIINLLNETN
ncbi:glycosyltransferase family 1 protein [Pedobacter chinensis]|uniref:Glycosyltransferase family 1 protein n=1 Tax=Pedobacter chinensis TaxID=2282421 RepID=A0A369PZT5_9SPHI|nr:glycosyltransferase family 4 protein [Pedobacter chinensis]RDC56209.1 glycosyltransferase family 1 protein [Pedobacter chinensis]